MTQCSKYNNDIMTCHDLCWLKSLEKVTISNLGEVRPSGLPFDFNGILKKTEKELQCKWNRKSMRTCNTVGRFSYLLRFHVSYHFLFVLNLVWETHVAMVTESKIRTAVVPMIVLMMIVMSYKKMKML